VNKRSRLLHQHDAATVNTHWSFNYKIRPWWLLKPAQKLPRAFSIFTKQGADIATSIDPISILDYNTPPGTTEYFTNANGK